MSTVGAVVVDTGVLGAPLDRRRDQLRRLYAPHLLGRVAVIAVQTVAELRYGALVAGWGERRLRQLERLVSAAAVAPADDDLVWAHARLRVSCRRAGHALAGHAHAADLWIAATAVRHGLALVSHDGVFGDAPGLALITELA